MAPVILPLKPGRRWWTYVTHRFNPKIGLYDRRVWTRAYMYYRHGTPWFNRAS